MESVDAIVWADEDDVVPPIDIEESARKRRIECPSSACEMELDVIIAPLIIEAQALRGGSTKNALFRRLQNAAHNLGTRAVLDIVQELKRFLDDRPLSDSECGTCSKTAKAVLIEETLRRFLSRFGVLAASFPEIIKHLKAEDFYVELYNLSKNLGKKAIVHMPGWGDLELEFHRGEPAKIETVTLASFARRLHDTRNPAESLFHFFAKFILSVSKKWGKKVLPTEVPPHVEFPVCSEDNTGCEGFLGFPIRGGFILCSVVEDKESDR